MMMCFSVKIRSSWSFQGVWNCWTEVLEASMVCFTVLLLDEANEENGFTVNESPMGNRDLCYVSIWVSS